MAITEPSAIVPPEADERDALLVVDALFDSLTAIDEEQRAVPAAAQRWYPDATSTTWTFVLQPDATFHDGSPVTAADFAFAWNLAARDEAVGYHLRHVVGYDAVVRGSADALRGVEVIDDHTLRVHLAAPLATFPLVVAHPSLGPVPRERWTRDAAAERIRPVGNGPFAMAEGWARGRFIRAHRAEGGGRDRGPTAAAVDEVIFRIMDPDSAYLAFQQGRIDFATLPPGALDEAIEAYGRAAVPDRGVGVLLPDEPTTYLLGFSVTQPPYDRVEVRRAVSLAVDRETLAAAVLDGSARRATSLVPPALEGARPGSCSACTSDVEEARALFAAAGVDELTLWFSEGGGHRQVAERLRADLAAAGVRLRLRSLPFEDFLAAVRAGSAGMFRWGWSADHPTPDDVLTPLFSSTSEDNVFGYADEEVDALLAEARATADPERRLALYQQAEDRVIDRDQVVVPLFTYRHRLVVGDRVRGLRVDPFGRPDWALITLRDTGATEAAGVD
ncbi:MAG TPA: ABC transporter substrate-binding protein [Egibacteraceae bacterium]